MTGVDIIGVLLLAPEPIEGVDPDSIMADRLPDDTPNPSLLVRTISSNEAPQLDRQPDARVWERVAVAVRANSRRERIAIADRVVDRCAGFTGKLIVDEIDVVGISVVPAGRGPAVNGINDTFEQTIDLMVSFIPPARPGE